MKIKDLRSMSKEDLNSKLTELRKELIKHNAQIATGTTPKSPGQIKEIKKTIAKIMTIVGTQRVSKLEDRKSSGVGSQTTKESDATHTQKESKETAGPSKEEKKVEKKAKAPTKKSEEE